MRRTLTISLIVAILLIAVAPSLAQGIVWSGNAVSVTESTELSGVTTRINAKRNGQPLAGFTSKSGICAEIVAHPSMTYPCSLETAGIANIHGAIITPDHGKTIWPATLIPGKGYTVNLPIGPIQVTLTKKVPKEVECSKYIFFHGKKTVWIDEEYQAVMPGLPIGEMVGLEWRVLSKDKHNKLRLVVIPISWDSSRTNSINVSVLVQQAPVGLDKMTDLMVFAHLRGFEPAWSSPDPAVFVRQKMVNDLMATPANQIPDRQPIDTGGDQPVVVQPKTVQSQPQPQTEVKPSLPQGVSVVGRVQVETTQVENVQAAPQAQPVYAKVNVYIWKGNEKRVWQNQTMMISAFQEPLTVEFWRVMANGRSEEMVSKGEARYLKPINGVEIHLFQGYDFPANSDIIRSEEEN